MKICPDHWHRLGEAIVARGLGKYIANSAASALRTVNSGGFEPLLLANWVIEKIAATVMAPSEALEMGCPLCLAVKEHAMRCHDPGCAFDADIWIELAANSQLQAAADRHLLARC